VTETAKAHDKFQANAVDSNTAMHMLGRAMLMAWQYAPDAARAAMEQYYTVSSDNLPPTADVVLHGYGYETEKQEALPQTLQAVAGIQRSIDIFSAAVMDKDRLLANETEAQYLKSYYEQVTGKPFDAASVANGPLFIFNRAAMIKELEKMPEGEAREAAKRFINQFPSPAGWEGLGTAVTAVQQTQASVNDTLNDQGRVVLVENAATNLAHLVWFSTTMAPQIAGKKKIAIVSSDTFMNRCVATMHAAMAYNGADMRDVEFVRIGYQSFDSVNWESGFQFQPPVDASEHEIAQAYKTFVGGQYSNRAAEFVRTVYDIKGDTNNAARAEELVELHGIMLDGLSARVESGTASKAEEALAEFVALRLKYYQSIAAGSEPDSELLSGIHDAIGAYTTATAALEPAIEPVATLAEFGNAQPPELAAPKRRGVKSAVVAAVIGAVAALAGVGVYHFMGQGRSASAPVSGHAVQAGIPPVPQAASTGCNLVAVSTPNLLTITDFDCRAYVMKAGDHAGRQFGDGYQIADESRFGLRLMSPAARGLALAAESELDRLFYRAPKGFPRRTTVDGAMARLSADANAERTAANGLR